MSSDNTSKCFFNNALELIMSAGVLTIAAIIIMKDVNQRIDEAVAEKTRRYEEYITHLNREITEIHEYAAELENKILITHQTVVPVIEEISQAEDNQDNTV